MSTRWGLVGQEAGPRLDSMDWALRPAALANSKVPAALTSTERAPPCWMESLAAEVLLKLVVFEVLEVVAACNLEVPGLVAYH